MSDNFATHRSRVLAVVVAHDGARWLGGTLDAVLRQTRRPDLVVGVDNGSRDGSGRLLVDALGAGNVLTLPRSTGFGEAVAEVLDRLPPHQSEWIWLLHDDCAPAADALAALLHAAAQDPKAAVLGPKLRDWLDRRMLLEVGVTVGPTGRRETGLEPREYDQGQHDGIRDVLAVSTAGMLVRRDVWDQVGGLDPRLPLFRDDLDLCWRVRNAGHRVLNVTAAVAWHAEAAARRRRRVGAVGEHPRRLDRRNALFVVLANLPLRAFLFAVARNFMGSLVRAVLFLLAKQPAQALDEVAALGSVLGSPSRLLRARRARAPGRGQHYPQVKRLLTPPGAAYQRLVDMLQGYLSGAGPVETAGRHHAVAAGREDGEELLTDVGLMQRIFGHPGVLLVLALLAITLVAERGVLLGDRLGGGALVPVLGGASDLWRLYTESFHGIGLGTDGWAPPYVAVLAGVSTIMLGKTWLAVTVLLLGCVPLAGLSAYLATRSLIPDTTARVWLAATYALLPVATGAISAGRLGTAVVFVLLPVYASLATVVLAGEARRSRRAAWGLGLLLAVGAAFAPLVYPLTAVLGGLGALAFGGARKGVGLSVGIALAVPIVLLFPWLVQIAGHPGQILLEAGLHRPELVDPRLPAEHPLLLGPGGPGVPPYWVTVGLVTVALAALPTRRGRASAAVGWGVALVGVLVAILASRIEVTAIAGSAPAPAWPGVPLAFAATGLLVVAAFSAGRLRRFGGRGGLRRAGALVAAAVAFSTPVLAAGFWIVEGVPGPLRGAAPDTVPALVASASGNGERTLVIRRGADDLLTYTVLRGRTPLIGEAEIPPAEEMKDRLAVAAGGLAAGRGGRDVEALAAHGVHFVVVAPSLGGPSAGAVDPAISGALDAEPALTRMTLSRSMGVWRLTRPFGRAWVVDAAGVRTPVAVTESGGRLVVDVPAGDGDRTLVLAEPVGWSSGGWTATAGGAGLPGTTVDGWAQGFRLGATEGRVEIAHGDAWRRGWLWAQAVLLIAMSVFASPGSRAAPDDYGGIAPEVPDGAGAPAEPAPAGRRRRRAEVPVR